MHVPGSLQYMVCRFDRSADREHTKSHPSVQGTWSIFTRKVLSGPFLCGRPLPADIDVRLSISSCPHLAHFSPINKPFENNRFRCGRVLKLLTQQVRHHLPVCSSCRPRGAELAADMSSLHTVLISNLFTDNLRQSATYRGKKVPKPRCIWCRLLSRRSLRTTTPRSVVHTRLPYLFKVRIGCVCPFLHFFAPAHQVPSFGTCSERQLASPAVQLAPFSISGDSREVFRPGESVLAECFRSLCSVFWLVFKNRRRWTAAWLLLLWGLPGLLTVT